ncbi:MAG: hypothetical protein ACO37W_11650 [Prochlorotrichaceae cyanobacterium]
MEVYIRNRKVKLKPQQAIGKGGEAEVFQWKTDRAIKLFKSSTHPDYEGLPQEQQAAAERLRVHQHKLRQFPQALPATVIVPEDLVTDRTEQQILGYTMPLVKDATVLLRYSDRRFRQTVATQTVVTLFEHLHHTVAQLHQQQVVIGDFNDLNILVKGTDSKPIAYLIDADSFQFANFPCGMFTARFVDPLLCDPQALQPLLQHPHTPCSDWYAFTVMLMQCLLFVDPYGGIYRPKDPLKQIPATARSLHRITIFHPEVRYPKPALPYDRLPDDLLHHFHQVFHQDWRGIFPAALLAQLHWTTCKTCGVEHARSHCPQCATAQVLPLSVSVVTRTPETTIVRGRVIATQVFQTKGLILHAASYPTSKAPLTWIYWQEGHFYRGHNSMGAQTLLLDGDLTANLYWGSQGQNHWIAQGDQVILFENASTPPQPRRFSVDRYRGMPQFATNQNYCYWLEQGQLRRDQTIVSPTGAQVWGSVIMGDVLAEQTQFWVGEQFGFGFYQAGHLHRAFVFDATRPALKDSVQLPRWVGELVQTTCTFSAQYAWLFLTVQEQGQLRQICHVITPSGMIVASATSDEASAPWLALLNQSHPPSDRCSYCAMNHFLLAATDQGIIKVEIQQNQLVQTQLFADTEPFVDSSCQLLPHPDGLWVIHPQSIQLLKLQ